MAEAAMGRTRRVEPLRGAVNASVSVPGSKSIANRALVCAALADGDSELSGVPDGDDTTAMLDCLRGLGSGVEDTNGGRVTISGPPPSNRDPVTLHAGLAGTTSRFVTALAALGPVPATIDGAPPLRRRPFGPLHEALGQLGVEVRPGERPGHLPVTVHGPPSTGRARIRGDVSSQYVTALMLIGPRLPGGLQLDLTSPLVSRPYVELTRSVMGWFGIDQVTIGDDRIDVDAGSYRPATTTIEPDASSAGYPLAIAAVTGGSIEIPGLGARSLQGDVRFADLLADMGCGVERDDDRIRITGPVELAGLRGIDVDMADISDLVPTVAVVAACASTPTTIRGVGFIRAKESDRLGDLAAELRRAGVDVTANDDGLEIRPSRRRLRGARLATHDDHRLAMAFAVLGTVVEGIEIEAPDVVTKSWPGFWTMLESLR